ncbi:hypothetical protein CMO89_01740 [Candidatus Woesearchaeota archaeon]|nr:hypothetical protein [Candidatus Woesearchaeota archaeon]|tara:strand:- start:2114 stop:2833 length:720 start_codon:yes stop_codon:yes gene_type:complete
MIEDSLKGKRVLIGAGEEADVYLYLDGIHQGKIGRLPRREEHYGRNTILDAFLLFRKHQIAYLLFPQHNINVMGQDLIDREMYSERIRRSEENVYHSSIEGVGHRKELAKIQHLPPKADEVFKKMLSSGIYVHSGIPNLSVLEDEVRFFEVLEVHADLARETLQSRGMDQPAEAYQIIEAFEFERKLPFIDLDMLLTDARLRSEILGDYGKQQLAALYSREIGNTVTGDQKRWSALVSP